ncbi:GBS Bsp-like repeat-containing protein [Streptococcus australis]|uniref:GBS Bsp-like repeat-containing protein n=1 Tax=Streptococcus australis TaxID=113107 RepID=UPI001CBD8236|nr:GBS Bsp-like repeat-containing protein [Streptococcus australis]MBZ2153421.1 GBS Bsp-like repeat-containing protein [Streptococcus australis]
MRKKDLIYVASAAVLMAASTQVAQADELTGKDPAQVENEQRLASPDLSASTVEDAAKETSLSYPAPATVTELSNESGVSEKTQEQGTGASVEKEEATTSTEEVAKPETRAGSTFFTASSQAPNGRSTDVAVQPKSFVDVSSHNGYISVEDYQVLARKGVGGVVVKLTEGTTYTNPYAEGQVRNAQTAGLQVSTYAFSRYTSEEQAKAEARHYISVAKRLNLPTTTVMVNDMEDAKMQANINRNTQAWTDEMRKNGYTNLMYYTSASWIDENNLRKKGPVSTAQFGLKNFWVAQYPSPKLSVNDAKNLRYNGGAGAWQFTSQAELLPGKHVFDQSVDYSGRFTTNAKPIADPTRGNLNGKISIENKDDAAGRFDVLISNVTAPNGVLTVSVPVWSDINGQDDLVWYTATKQVNGTYKVSVKASDHKNSRGKYHVHLYYNQLNGQSVGVAATTTELATGKDRTVESPSGTVSNEKASGRLTIENNNGSTGTFDAVVRDVVAPNGVKEVLLPVWSEANGQDDLVWHKAVRQSDGSYRATIKASEHKNSQGKYLVHAYYVTPIGDKEYVASTGATVHHVKPTGNLTIENKNDIAGTFDAVIRDVVAPTGLQEVLLPTWSEVNGQDDLVWHKAVRQSDGSYRVTIKASDHKYSQGKYLVHAYYLTETGTKEYVTSTSTTVRQRRSAGTLTIENNNSTTGSFDAVIRDIVSPNGLKEVLVPAWSEVNGQDDLVWHKATQQADGSYRVTIKASEHKNSQGKYLVHAYYVTDTGTKEYVASTGTTVRQSKVTGTLTITNKNSEVGTFDVIVSDVFSPKGVKTVQVPIWSDKDGQDDIIWYNGNRQTDGTYKVSVKASDHKNSTGKYHIHLYYIQEDGTRVGVATSATEVTYQNLTNKTKAYITNVNASAGTYTVAVDQAPQGRRIKQVRVAVWSQPNQENLYWYSTASSGTHTEVAVSAIHHGNQKGDYTTHVYVDYTDNTVEGFNLGKTSLSPQNQKVNPKTTYYSQRDPRWGSKWYGISNMDQSGCVPTSLAMTFTDILGVGVTPTAVADYLYNQTDTFNKTSGAGTDAQGIVSATQKWGLNSQMLTGASTIAASLQAGKHVLAAVGPSRFINAPYTHEIVLHGYDNGKTYVRDPFNAANNGWYGIDYIHSLKSTDPMDTKLGSPFFSIFA